MYSTAVHVVRVTVLLLLLLLLLFQDVMFVADNKQREEYLVQQLILMKDWNKNELRMAKATT